MPIEVGFIVEGHGDVDAVPLVFRRIVENELPDEILICRTVLRVARDKLKRAGELERAVEFVARKVGQSGCVFISIDSEGDCPAHLGPMLLERAQLKRADRVIGVALAKREFESWFIAAASSIAGKRGLRVDLTIPPDPELIAGAKEWLTRNMVGKPYKETRDQEKLARLFDLNLARRAASFDKFYRETIRVCKSLAEINC
jgi:Domain of unknown function (DUF4276)